MVRICVNTASRFVFCLYRANLQRARFTTSFLQRAAMLALQALY